MRFQTVKLGWGVLVSTACGLLVAPAAALDKQGSAHVGAVEGESSGFGVSGALLYGVSLYNPTYAARPDNTGLSLYRYAAHADVDLIGRRLSIPLDVNLFTDGTRKGGNIFVPTEGDIIAGVTSTWELGPGALEWGARFEHDRPLDREGFSQTYGDARTRYLYSLATTWPSLGRALSQGDVSGWLGLGGFLFNPTYAARPDNSGRALLRYMVHTELSVFSDLISFGVDGTFFTDRRANDVIGPSELDWTAEIIGRSAPFELHVAYERDMPVDRGGLVQQFVYMVGVYAFDFHREEPHPLTNRTQPVSP